MKPKVIFEMNIDNSKFKKQVRKLNRTVLWLRIKVWIYKKLKIKLWVF